MPGSHEGATGAPRRKARRLARWALILASAASVLAFILTSVSLNSAPAPRNFNGWAAVFLRDGSSKSRVFLRMAPLEPGGYGDHPPVEYNVAACGPRDFDGVLVLAGDARLRLPDRVLNSRSPDQEGSVRLVTGLSTLTITDLGGDRAAIVAGVQVLRVKLPAIPCRVPFYRRSDAPPFIGSPMMVRGPLEGRTMREGFAPFGHRPVRQAQSWPPLGRAPMFGPSILGGFLLNPRLPGVWMRPLQAYYGIDVGVLDGKASVDLARPQPTSTESLAWTSSIPFAAKARVTNNDNLSWWQTWSLAAGIGLGIGGSILAALALEVVHPGSERRPAAPPSASTVSTVATATGPGKARPVARMLLDLWIVGLALAWRAVSRRR